MGIGRLELVLVAAALCMAAGVAGHTVVGYIINDSELSYSLTLSEVQHGDMKTPPAGTLGALSQTFFELTSPLWNDRISYNWAYTPASSWCPTSSGAASGTYQYLFGDNTCSGSQSYCGDAGNMTVVVQNCQKPVGTSYPTYNIHLYTNSSYGG